MFLTRLEPVCQWTGRRDFSNLHSERNENSRGEGNMTKSNRRDGSGPEMPEMTLRDMLAPLFRHRRMVLISFCCVFLAAIVVAWAWAARYYVSTMQVVVEQD